MKAPALTALLIALSASTAMSKDFVGDHLPDGTETPLADNITGTGDADDIQGLLLNDTLSGVGGDDTISGGPDDDTVYGGTGDDTINGDSGVDDLYGGEDNDTIYGGSGGDEIYGGSGADDLQGEDNDDTIFGGTGGDLIEGGKGNDTISGDELSDQIFGGPGKDHITGGPDNDELHGDDDDDDLYGGSGQDTLIGGDGGDYLEGNGNGGTIDTFQPGNDNDTSLGSDDVDIFDLATDVTKATGINFVTALGGSDHVNGGLKSDRVNTGKDRDFVDDPGEGAADQWRGGPGSDTLRYTAADHELTFDLSLGKHKGPDGDYIAGFENFFLSPKSDTMVIDYQAADTVNTDSRSQTYLLRIYGALAAGIKTGDKITVNGNKPAAGLKTPKYGAFITTFDGSDKVTGGELADGITTFDGDDFIYSRGGNDEINSGKGDDLVESGPGEDKIYAEEGSDFLEGGPGGDGINVGQVVNLHTGQFSYDKDPDRVIYGSVTDSPPGKGKFDVIDAFDPSRDKVDLSAIDANSTTKINDKFEIVSVLSGKPGELHVDLVAAPMSHLEIHGETNGKPGEDLYIELYPPTFGKPYTSAIPSKIILP